MIPHTTLHRLFRFTLELILWMVCLICTVLFVAKLFNL